MKYPLKKMSILYVNVFVPWKETDDLLGEVVHAGADIAIHLEPPDLLDDAAGGATSDGVGLDGGAGGVDLGVLPQVDFEVDRPCRVHLEAFLFSIFNFDNFSVQSLSLN